MMTLQHLGGRGLLLQRLGQIVGALAQLVEQARVLDGDDGLGGEVRDQLDLLVGERPHFRAVDADRADQLAFLEHRHGELRPYAGKFWRARDCVHAASPACRGCEQPASSCSTVDRISEPGDRLRLAALRRTRAGAQAAFRCATE